MSETTGQTESSRAPAADEPRSAMPLRPGAAELSTAPLLTGWPGPLAIAALAIAPYLFSLTSPFVFDDLNDITAPPGVHALWPPAWMESGRPVVTFTFAVCWVLGGGATWPFHALNVAIHAANALLLLYVVRRACLLPRVPQLARSNASAIAMWTAALWCVHPLHTSAVTYVVHRYESLASLFCLLTVLLFLRVCETSSRQLKWVATTCAAALLACWSKEIAITLPVLLLLLDATLVSGSLRELVRRRWLAHALIGATVVLALLSVIGPRDVNSSQGMHLTQLRPVDYARTELGVVARYMRQIVWPTDLAVDYFDWPIARTLRDVMPGALVTIGAMAATAVLILRRHSLGLVCGWFFVLLAPTSSFLPLSGELVAERRLYLALAAPALLLSIALHGLKSRPRRAVAVGLAFVVAALGATTLRRNHDYRSASALLGDTVAKRPANPRARYNYGNALKDEGRIDLALEQYRAGMAVDPGYMSSYQNAVVAANRLGIRNPWEDQSPLTSEQAGVLDASAEALVARADEAFAAGRVADAVAALREAARVSPRSTGAHTRLAILLALDPVPGRRRGEEALRAGLRAWGLRGGEFDPVLGEAVAAAFAELSRFDDAIRVLRQLATYLEAAGMADMAAAQLHQAEAYRRHERWSPGN